MSREEPYYIPIPEEYGRRKLNALYRGDPAEGRHFPAPAEVF